MRRTEAFTMRDRRRALSSRALAAGGNLAVLQKRVEALPSEHEQVGLLTGLDALGERGAGAPRDRNFERLACVDDTVRTDAEKLYPKTIQFGGLRSPATPAQTHSGIGTSLQKLA
jgi:hypothetical protein